MDSYVRGLIEYHGINNCPHEEIPIFRQSNIDYTFSVPGKKAAMEQLVKVWVTPKILEHKLVKTPVGMSLEGQKNTGYKMMLTGDIHYKVEYVAKAVTQTLHTAYTVVPFCGYIVLPERFNPNSYVVPSVFVEDIYSEQLDCKSVYNNITVLFIADIC